MSTATSLLSPASSRAQPVFIEENSCFRKAIACIPIVGAVFATIQISSLARKRRLESILNVPRVIELIHVEGQFQLAAAFSSLLTVALIVAGIALEMISGPYLIGLYAVATCDMLIAGWNLIQIDETYAQIDRHRF